MAGDRRSNPAQCRLIRVGVWHPPASTHRHGTLRRGTRVTHARRRRLAASCSGPVALVPVPWSLRTAPAVQTAQTNICRQIAGPSAIKSPSRSRLSVPSGDLSRTWAERPGVKP